MCEVKNILISEGVITGSQKDSKMRVFRLPDEIIIGAQGKCAEIIAESGGLPEDFHELKTVSFGEDGLAYLYGENAEDGYWFLLSNQNG